MSAGTIYYEITAVSAAEKRHVESGQRDAGDSDADFVKYDYTTQGHGETTTPVYGLMAMRSEPIPRNPAYCTISTANARTCPW